ncbi:MAG: hypothetical protein AB7V32_01900 [Candidatus Berkiella sp.]
MKTAPQRQASIYDLLQPGSYQRLKSAFSEFDIKIDPRTLILNNQTKESILSQILSDLASSPKVIKLAQTTTQFHQTEVDEMLAQKKNIEDLRIFSLMRCLFLNAVAKEAYEKYFKTEQMKELLRDLKELLIKIASADFDRQLRIAEAEKDKLMQLEKELQEFFNNEMHNSFDDNVHHLSKRENAIRDINHSLRNLQVQTDETLKDLKDESKKTATQMKEKHKEELKDVKEEDLSNLIHDCQIAMSQAHYKAYKYEQKDKLADRLDELDKVKLQSIQERRQELEREKQNAKHMLAGNFIAQKHEKRVRIPGQVIDDIEREKAELDDTENKIKAKMERRQERRQERAEKKAKLSTDPDAILKAQIDAHIAKTAQQQPSQVANQALDVNAGAAQASPAAGSQVAAGAAAAAMLGLLQKEEVKQAIQANFTNHEGTNKLTNLKMQKQEHKAQRANEMLDAQIEYDYYQNFFQRSQSINNSHRPPKPASPADVQRQEKLMELAGKLKDQKYAHLTPEKRQKKEERKAAKRAAAAAAADASATGVDEQKMDNEDSQLRRPSRPAN